MGSNFVPLLSPYMPCSLSLSPLCGYESSTHGLQRFRATHQDMMREKEKGRVEFSVVATEENGSTASPSIFKTAGT